MAFTFPEDAKLFRDLDSVRAEGSSWYEILVQNENAENATFGKAFRDILDKQRSEKLPSVRTKGTSAYEAEKNAEKKIRGYFRERFNELEAAADQWADKDAIGSFPRSYMYTVTYVDSQDRSDRDEYTLDYFDEMNRATGFMCGPGRVGRFLSRADGDLKFLKGKKPKPVSFITLFLLLVGVVVCLAGAMPFPFLPQTVAELMNTSIGVRLAVLAAMALAGWTLLLFGPVGKEEKGMFFIKILVNGLVILIVAIGSTLIAMRSAFSEVPMEAYELLPFGGYYILCGLFLMVNDICSFFQTLKNIRQTKQAFCTRVEKNIQHLHRYIRFHTLWWKAQNKKAALPDCLRNLERSRDHLLQMYKKYR